MQWIIYCQRGNYPEIQDNSKRGCRMKEKVIFDTNTIHNKGANNFLGGRNELVSCKYSRTEKYINASLNPLSDLSLSSKGGFLSRARSVIFGSTSLFFKSMCRMKEKVIFDTNTIHNKGANNFLGGRNELKNFLKDADIVIPEIVPCRFRFEI
jgi:rRNA-processing protein FCF1